MPKARWNVKSTPDGGGFEQSLLDHYFPKDNWLPAIHAHEQKPTGNGTTYMPITRIIILASCSWCGCCVEQTQWRNHINFHTNAI